MSDSSRLFFKSLLYLSGSRHVSHDRTLAGNHKDWFTGLTLKQKDVHLLRSIRLQPTQRGVSVKNLKADSTIRRLCISQPGRIQVWDFFSGGLSDAGGAFSAECFCTAAVILERAPCSFRCSHDSGPYMW